MTNKAISITTLKPELYLTKSAFKQSVGHKEMFHPVMPELIGGLLLEPNPKAGEVR